MRAITTTAREVLRGDCIQVGPRIYDNYAEVRRVHAGPKHRTFYLRSVEGREFSLQYMPDTELRVARVSVSNRLDWDKRQRAAQAARS